MKQNYTILLFVVFILILLLPTFGCKSGDSKLAQTKIEEAIRLGDDKPEQALSILDSIQEPDISADQKNYMLYQIASIKAKLNAGKEIDKNNQIVKAADYFDTKKDKQYAILANYYAGLLSYLNGKQEVAFTYFLKALPYVEYQNDSLLIGKEFYNLGSLYYDQQIYDSTALYTQKAISFLVNKPELQVLAYRLAASSYYHLDNLDKAFQLLNEGKFLLDDPINKNFINIYNGVYAAIYKNRKEYDKAALYFWQNLKEDMPRSEQLRAAINLTEMYNLANNRDSATYYKDFAEPWLDKYELKNIDDDYLVLLSYKVLLNYYISQKGDKDKIAKYFDLYSRKRAYMDRNNISKELFQANQQVSTQRIYAANREYNLKVLMYVTISILILFFLILFIIKIRFKKREAAVIDIEIQKINNLRDQLDRLKNSENRNYLDTDL